ncbi:MAG: hypothetical protein HFI85_03255 [Clostridia bacterium]|jgi:Ser-tRNA(Ala) deacylase AlaX|nr:hypothetical protein [Clostridia bacterium]
MKNKTKSKLFKTKGIIKKVGLFAPFISLAVGLGLGIGLMAGGGVKYEKAKADFKESPVYVENYTQEYNEIKEKYDNGDIDLNELVMLMEDLNDEERHVEVLKQAGDEAKEFKDALKTGERYMLASISGWILTVGGLVTTFIWVGTDVFENINWSARQDFSMARTYRDLPDLPMKKKSKSEEKNEEDEFSVEGEGEEELPDIKDAYYRD